MTLLLLVLVGVASIGEPLFGWREGMAVNIGNTAGLFVGLTLLLVVQAETIERLAPARRTPWQRLWPVAVLWGVGLLTVASGPLLYSRMGMYGLIPTMTGLAWGLSVLLVRQHQVLALVPRTRGHDG